VSALEVVGAIGVLLGTGLVLYVVLWLDGLSSPAPTLATPTPQRVTPQSVLHEQRAA
jgi:hypothetical protein